MKICTTLIEVSSEQWRSQFISIRSPAAVAAAAAAAAAALCVLLILLLLLQQQCCCFLLLFVIVSMAKFIADSLELMPAFSVSSFKCDFFFKQKTAYEIMPSLVGSEMCIRDRTACSAKSANHFICP